MPQHKISPDSPIGIFDSGIGGLTVVKAVQASLPAERLIYFGDTARVPYGTKSQVTIRKYAREDTELLMKHQPKLIIVACNTVSALALDVVEQTAGGIPVIGVLKAGAELAAQRTKAGFIDHPATRLIAEEYLAAFTGKEIDTLVLGCTHYPILRKVIESIAGPEITIIDSAEAVATKAEELLASRNILNRGEEKALPHLMVSDLPQKFRELYRLFMGTELPDVELVGM